MKKNLLTVFSISAIVLAFSVLSFAQEKSTISSGASKYVISAEAGGVNYIRGKSRNFQKNRKKRTSSERRYGKNRR